MCATGKCIYHMRIDEIFVQRLYSPFKTELTWIFVSYECLTVYTSRDCLTVALYSTSCQ